MWRINLESSLPTTPLAFSDKARQKWNFPLLTQSLSSLRQEKEVEDEAGASALPFIPSLLLLLLLGSVSSGNPLLEGGKTNVT